MDALKNPLAQSFLIFIIGCTICAFTVQINGVEYGWIGGVLGVLAIVIANTLTSILYAWQYGYYDSHFNFTNHAPRAIIRSTVLTLLPLLVALTTHSPIYLILIFHNFTVFYLLFDLFYNHYRGNHWGYVGNTATIDRIVRQINTISFFQKLSPMWYFCFRASLVIYSITLIHKHLQL